jgi:UDP-glucose:(heptosyl)LPS alpha-1,3-glucosyltransferase
LKIALGIFKYFPFGGLQVDMRNIALEFARRGEDVTVFTGEWNSEESFPGVKVEVLKPGALTNHARALEFSRAFHSAAEKFDIKVAFNRFGGCDFYFAADDCYRAALDRRKGAFFLRHFGRYKVFSDLEEAIFSPQSDTVVFYICQKQLEEFSAVYHTPPERLIYLGPGVSSQFVLPDAKVRQQRRAALGIKENQNLALFVAANWKLKGGDRALESFAALPSEIKQQTRLHFVGGDGNGEAQKSAARLGIWEYCWFHGPQKDTSPFVQAADVLIHPARKEATGGVIAEALACGVPVIATGLCGYASLIRESAAGIVMEGDFSADGLLNAWQSYFKDRARFAELAANAAVTLRLKGRSSDAVDIILGSKES